MRKIATILLTCSVLLCTLLLTSCGSGNGLVIEEETRFVMTSINIRTRRNFNNPITSDQYRNYFINLFPDGTVHFALPLPHTSRGNYRNTIYTRTDSTFVIDGNRITIIRPERPSPFGGTFPEGELSGFDIRYSNGRITVRFTFNYNRNPDLIRRELVYVAQFTRV